MRILHECVGVGGFSDGPFMRTGRHAIVCSMLGAAASALSVDSSPFALVMQARRQALAHEGEWTEAPSCLVHVQSDGRIQLWSGADDEVTVSTVFEAAGALLAARRDITFAALDRRRREPLTAALAAPPYQYSPRYCSPCGLYRPVSGGPPPPPPLPAGVVLRALRDADAPLIDSRWTYRSDHSLVMVRAMVRAGLGCLGIEEDGALRGWVLRYLDGSLGMLWVEEADRRKGYAARLIARARADMEAAGVTCFAYIVDGNAPSELCFAREGWTRVADADWVGFGAASEA